VLFLSFKSATLPLDNKALFHRRPQVHVIELIKELGLEVHDQFSKGAKFARLSDGSVRKYSSSLPKISPFSLLDIYFFINKVRCVGERWWW
jgi:hypothetical protein